MKVPATLTERKRQSTPLVTGSALQHTAVQPVADEEKPALNGVRLPTAGRDFSTVQTQTAACPMIPTHCPFGGACHACPLPIQTKLAISKPGDKYEQEADRVAEHVMEMPVTQLQRRAANQIESTQVPPIAHEVLHSPGQPLDPTTRAFIEPRFGHDFSQVRVHTDAKAAESAQAVSALAYTVGRDVVFGAGQYRPSTVSGIKLLAHEMTHVIQQGNYHSLPMQLGLERNSSVGITKHETDNIAQNVIADAAVFLQHTADDKALQRSPAPKAAPAKSSNTIAAEDVTGIIAEQMQMWYLASRLGIERAKLEGGKDAAKYFLLALGGNLVWAATTFVAPEAVLAIRLMAVGGATVGAGTIEKLASEDLPISDFRDKAISSLGNAYQSLLDNRPKLTTALQAIYVANGLTRRDNAAQAEKRRKEAWKYLFRSNIGYANPIDLETQIKTDIESIWKYFKDCYESIDLPITPNYIQKDFGKYVLVCYYRAIVSSGVADRSIGVKRTSLSLYKAVGGKGEITVTFAGEIYDFPGGAQVKETPHRRDFWFGNLTATVP